MKNRSYLFLAVVFGFISTLLSYIGYGVSDHIEQLPIIYRLFDSSFLAKDFFVNVNEHSSARIHYSQLLAFLSGSERNLPFLFIVLTYISNISISVITLYFGRMIFKQSDRVGIVASAIVMVVPTFELGYFDVIYSRLLTPSTIATPMALGAILLVFRGNLLAGVILCCLTTLVQPLIGLEIAGLLLFTYAFSRFIEGDLLSREEIAKIIPSLFLIAIGFILSAIPYLHEEKISSESFIYILAHFRHPHHYLPSTFGCFDYVKGMIFLTAILVICHRLIRLQENPCAKYSVIMIYSTVLLCVGGYVFVELIPTRIWATAQVFRLLFFVKWLGLVLFAGMLMDSERYQTVRKRYLPFIVNAITIAVMFLSEGIRNRFLRNSKNGYLLYIPVTVLLFVLIGTRSISITSIGVFASFMIAIYLADFLSFSKVVAVSLSVISSFILIVFTHNEIPGMKGRQSLMRIRNSMRLDYNYETYQSRVALIRYSLQNIPEESIFLTPPNWGEFRVLARKAIVVDFKAFPFADRAMEEWYKRMLDCYGNPKEHGFGMIQEMNDKYRQINDEALESLRKKYEYSYVVLYEETKTGFKTVYRDDQFKIVSLEGR